MYLQCARELAAAHPENLPSLVKQVIFNELSNQRSATNMPMLNALLSADGERGAASLAEVFTDLLLQKVAIISSSFWNLQHLSTFVPLFQEDYLRALRALLREIVRALRHDHINLIAFCQGLMKDRPKEQVREETPQAPTKKPGKSRLLFRPAGHQGV